MPKKTPDGSRDRYQKAFKQLMLEASSIYVINYWKPRSNLHAWNILTSACEPV